MKIKIVETPLVDKYFETTDLFEFPLELKKAVRSSIFRAEQVISAEVYRDTPSMVIEQEMATFWAKEYIDKSEGFTIEPVEHHYYDNSIRLEISKLVINPNLFKKLIRKTFMRGFDHANRFQKDDKTEIDSILDAIQSEVDSLQGLYPAELRERVKQIIQKYR